MAASQMRSCEKQIVLAACRMRSMAFDNGKASQEITRGGT